MAAKEINRFVFEDEEPIVSEPVKEMPVEQTISPKSKKTAEGFKLFGKEAITPEQVEAIRKPLMQKGVLPATEFVSSGLGFLGDIASITNSLIAKPIAKAVTGQETPYEETLVGKILPSSEQIHKGFETIAGEKIRPETTGEEILATGSGFLGSLVAGPGGYLKAGKFFGKNMPALVRNIIASFVPAGVLTATKEADFPPGIQAIATIISSLLTHKLTDKSFKQVAGDLYKKSEDIAKNVILPSDQLVSRVNKLEGEMSKGLPTGPKKAIGKLIDEIKGKSSAGTIPLENLVKARKDVIEAGKEFTVDQLKGSQNYWRALRAAIDESIGDYEKLNPEFGQYYRQANSLYRGLQETHAIESWLTKNKANFGTGLATEFLLYSIKHSLGGQIPYAIGLKLGEFTAALIRNPGLRKAYKDAIVNASKENVKGTASAINRMEKYLEQEGITKEKKEENRFIFED